MAKMTIIDVDLSKNIGEIISDDVRELTQQNKDEIQKAIDEKKEVVERKQARNQQEQNKIDALETAYQLLLIGHKENKPISIDSLLEAVHPIITNNSALIARLKNYLRKQKGNEYIISRRKLGGKPVYELNPYNTRESNEQILPPEKRDCCRT